MAALRRSKKKKSISKVIYGEQLWSVDKLYAFHRNPNLIFIDIREPGSFRGGPPSGTKELATTYHQGHVRVALNLNVINLSSAEEIQEEIHTGTHSAGGAFVDTIVLGITSNFHFLLYDNDGSSTAIVDLLLQVKIEYFGNIYSFSKDKLHFLEGGFFALQASKHTRALCSDTRSLLGNEIELEESEYSEVCPYLFVGGAVCTEYHYQELNSRGVKHVLNVSNIDTAPQGFEYKFMYADDDQTEHLSRIFRQSAEIIENAEKAGEGIFVHCQRGLSRSPTLVMAYLLLKKHICLRLAYETVRKCRPNIGPRSNFIAELCRLEYDLVQQGVKLEGYSSGMMYSLPIQVYEISQMRCGNYEDGMNFLFGRSPKRENECSIM